MCMKQSIASYCVATTHPCTAMHVTPKGRRDAEAMHEGFFFLSVKAKKFDSLTVGEFDSLTVKTRVAKPPGVAGARGGKVLTFASLSLP